MITLKDIGEFGLIDKFKKAIKLDSSVVVGSGDDCAVIESDRRRFMLLTCDMLVEGIDFTHQANPHLVGRKALAVSLSDIAACAGKPAYAVVSLGLPKDASLRTAQGITQGIFDLAQSYKVNIVGGDLSRADKIVIDVTVVGFVEKKFLVLRSGAKVKDIIFVSGPLGGASKGKHLTFNPRLKEARFLVENFKVNSMIDISDGLAQDLTHILKQSQVGAVIYENLIPLDKNVSNLKTAISEGEDFELLFTLSCLEAKKLLKNNPFGFKPIGEIVNKRSGLVFLNKYGSFKVINPQGFRHF